METQSAQQRGEQPVQLVAESAAPAHHDLVEQRVVVEEDRLSRMDTQILEGDAEQVRHLQPTQSFGGRGERAAIVDAFEISGSVHTRPLRDCSLTAGAGLRLYALTAVSIRLRFPRPRDGAAK